MRRNTVVMKKRIPASRGTEIDMRKCADNVGGSQFNLVLIAAERARELVKQNKNKEDFVKGTVDALLEIQEGKIGAEYLDKVGRK